MPIINVPLADAATPLNRIIEALARKAVAEHLARNQSQRPSVDDAGQRAEAPRRRAAA